MHRHRTWVASCVMVTTATVVMVRTLPWGGVTTASPATAAPKVVLAQDCFDLGTVPPGGPISLTLRVGNNGTRRLIVRHQPAGCACSGIRCRVTVHSHSRILGVDVRRGRCFSRDTDLRLRPWCCRRMTLSGLRSPSW